MRLLTKVVAFAAVALLFAVAQSASAASFVWKKQVGSAGTDYVPHVFTDSAGNIVTALATACSPGSAVDSCPAIVKYDPLGRQIWRRALPSGTDSLFVTPWRDVAVSPSGDVFVIELGSAGSVLAVKYNADGSLAWRRNVGGAGFTTYRDVNYTATDSNGNLVVLINHNGSAYFQTSAKMFDPSGNVVWAKSLQLFDKSHQVFADQVTCDHDGNFVVSGTGQSSPDTNTLVVAKYGPDGAKLFERLYNGANLFGLGSMQTSALAVGENGDIVVTGIGYYGCAQLYCTWVAKFSAVGAVVWSKLIDEIPNERSFSVSIDPTSGDVLLGGSRTDDIGRTVPWLAAYSSDGAPEWQWTWSLPSGTLEDAQISGLSVDPSSRIVFGGRTNIGLAGTYKGGDSDGFLAVLKR